MTDDDSTGHDAFLEGIAAALARGSSRARRLAEQTGTPFYVWKSGRLVDLNRGMSTPRGSRPVDRCGLRWHTMLERPMMPTPFDRISQTPNVLAGRAAIRGLRISVAHVVNLVANGMTAAEIIAELPDLEEEDIRQALAYAAALAHDECHPLRG